MTLATACADGAPWISPVFYVPDDAYNLHWVSWKEARHSENIRARGEVSIVIYAKEPVDAVYLTADAIELVTDEEARAGTEVMRRRPQQERWTIRALTDVIDEGPWRIYRAVPRSIEVRKEVQIAGLDCVTREPADFRQS